ncbi:sugar transferase [Bradyrhizobium sp.]|uniref:sugar transferase n=1 Tax=Bradyrhizobium sp. TaxID=376 RepID=UPI004037ACF6
MASIVTASFNRNEVRPLWQERTYISVRPVEFAGGGSYGAYSGSARRGNRRSRRIVRTEPASSIAKRIFDIAAAGSALLFFAPFFIAIAVAIKVTSPGPVFFLQYRYGYRNRRFRIYKFRTMRTDAGDVRGIRQTVEGDARVTSIGKILRKTSLDEIPQLINVIRGDMSLVGPRPHVPGMLAADLPYEDLVPFYFQRHTARPGITGLAQVSGCRGSTVESGRAISRIDYDLHYIENWSLRMDVTIILRTIRKEFLSGSGF